MSIDAVTAADAAEAALLAAARSHKRSERHHRRQAQAVMRTLAELRARRLLTNLTTARAPDKEA